MMGGWFPVRQIPYLMTMIIGLNQVFVQKFIKLYAILAHSEHILIPDDSIKRMLLAIF